MPDKHWEPPPGQEVRDRQTLPPDTEQPRKLESRARETELDYDDRFLEPEEINYSGSER